MTWTRTFVYGPMDPKWNRYKVFCHICTGNVFIYERGAREVLRHYATEPYLRKDQRWRHEHLATYDPVTKTIRNQVRGRDGKIFSPYSLEVKYPKFKHAEVVDIGEKLPFYEENMAGKNYMKSSSDNRLRVQTSASAAVL